MNPCLQEMPLALPEPMESRLAREYGVEPWMLAEVSGDFWDAVLALGLVPAYEKFVRADEMHPHTGLKGERLFDVLWDYPARETIRTRDRVLSTEAINGWKLFEKRREALASSIANDAVSQLRRRRDRARWARRKPRIAA